MTTSLLRSLPDPDLLFDRPFTWREAAAAGVSRHRLRTAASSGVIRQLLRDVWVPSTWPDDHGACVAALGHVMPSGGVAVDRTAAWLHGVNVFDHPEMVVAPRLEVATVGGGRASERKDVFGCQRDLNAAEIMAIGDTPVTTPLRTACDIACLRGRHRAIATLDSFRRRFCLSEADLWRQSLRFAGRRGVTQLRALIPLSRLQVDSPAESWLRLDIHDAGYPMPESQVHVHVPGWGPVRMENAYPQMRLAVEYDGEPHHSSEQDREHDRGRRRALADVLGWRIVVVRKDGFSGPGKDAWLAEFARAFEKRAPEELRKRVYAKDPTLLPRKRHRRRS